MRKLAAHGTNSKYVAGCRCMPCSAAHKSYMRDYYIGHREALIARSRQYSDGHREEEREWSRAARVRHCLRVREYHAHWARENREKRHAHRAVLRAVANGTLTRKGCEVCGAYALAHHDDYPKPLDVRWLCPKHHGRHHADLRCPTRAAASDSWGRGAA